LPDHVPFDSRVREDLRAPDAEDDAFLQVDETAFVQIAITTTIMGDANAVVAATQARRRMMLASKALRVQEKMFPGKPFPRGAIVGDVFIYDLLILMIWVFSAPPDDGEDFRRARKADAGCDPLRLTTNDKRLDAESTLA
jgi:hypothetical protein